MFCAEEEARTAFQRLWLLLDSLDRHLDIRPTEALAEYAIHYREQSFVMLGGDDEAVIDRQHGHVLASSSYRFRKVKLCSDGRESCETAC